ncbi:hypothetical protein [Tritonibacter mobilis]|uniref:hypothetical protein n=1 Tax=Tritonibacter mobilis TaxID=379347 RepID=UPI0012FF979C|nr:hypothetical protein [Tritonibacter mobilis]
MNTAEMIQTVLGLIAVGGIGGVWFRLGSVQRGQDEHANDIKNLDGRVRELEIHIWKGA